MSPWLFILSIFTSLLILLIKPDKTFPGPISIKWLTSLFIILITLSLHLTLFSICLINKSLSSITSDISSAVTFDISLFADGENFNLSFDADSEQEAEAQALTEVKMNLSDYITAYADEVEEWILKKHGI